MNKGGLGVHGLEGIRKGMPDHQIDDFDKMCHAHREGFTGWLGIGGSAFLYHPERKIGYSYVPSHISIVEIFAAKSMEFELII